MIKCPSAMYSSESSDCEFYTSQYDDTYSMAAYYPHPWAVTQPMVYYSNIPERKEGKYKGKKNPNCFVKAFRWYTQERGRQSISSNPKPEVDPENFAGWLDTKYAQYLREGRQNFGTQDVNYTQTSFSDVKYEKKPGTSNKSSRLRSPWSKRKNKKENGDPFTLLLTSCQTCQIVSRESRKIMIKSQSATNIPKECSSAPPLDIAKEEGVLKTPRCKKKQKTNKKDNVLKLFECQCEPLSTDDTEFPCDGSKEIIVVSLLTPKESQGTKFVPAPCLPNPDVQNDEACKLVPATECREAVRAESTKVLYKYKAPCGMELCTATVSCQCILPNNEEHKHCTCVDRNTIAATLLFCAHCGNEILDPEVKLIQQPAGDAPRRNTICQSLSQKAETKPPICHCKLLVNDQSQTSDHSICFDDKTIFTRIVHTKKFDNNRGCEKICSTVCEDYVHVV